MPDIPWSTPTQAAPDAEVYVMASRFETATLPGAFKFFLKAPGIIGQIRKAPGAHGVALRARVFSRTFLTLSAWEDRDALYRFARSEPHRSSSRAASAYMRESAFTFWTVPASELPISWAEAERRLAEQKQSY
ncbi:MULTISPECIES: DUF3291 domain-containing protein [unclassified Streptomyces]|uniref:DUF3291 domain-containing protein n=1 Tax=unclassified Streptomyces TaxID=2593676 RepID=UPI001BE94EE5|nr:MULTISPECIES: DUF3291 domain-containing protein [unclassified Streptomyces]MBT2402506.1 DUF3291 domain-containing protein [Streptomyces sp. ISL-21]MBT2456523.1 DUF3291 domain-containing protein [Streptomyces sp. ISL-86]MBT2610266.1 DUF3291 domain-containing protein [Streptomyces sp. ISL-87]